MNLAINPASLRPPLRTMVHLEDAGDPARFGHKAATLGELLRAGFDVPAGVVIPVGVDPAADELAVALGALGDGPFAVRSSGVAEDLEDASFAGQYESYLNVPAEGVAEAARRCVASASAAHVALYAGSTNHRAPAMAVLVQKMVPANAAGVVFSADPMSGDRATVVINATKGLGDKLISGEIDGDVWRVGAHGAVAAEQPYASIDRATAEELAAIARRIEDVRGAPQDIEWARSENRIFIVQARAITALPIRPEFTVPKGTWEKDSGHFPEPVCPFAASTHMHPPSMVDLLPDVGLMPDAMQMNIIGHEMYLHIEPDDGGAKAPPWWVIGIVARILPSIRRKMRRADDLMRSGYFEELPRRWNATLANEQRVELRRRAAIDLRALNDAELIAHLLDLRLFTAEKMRLHFELMIPHSMGMHELCTTCSDLLGWDVAQTARLLQGISSASAAPVHQLAKLADVARSRPATRQAIDEGGMQVAERLREVDPEVHEMFAAFMNDWGIRTYGPECSGPNVADRPDLVAGSIASLIAQGGIPDLEPERQRVIAEARAAHRTAQDRKRFDDALAYAELVYPMREDNVILTDQMVVGLVRVAGLEAGRRLHERGLIGNPEDVMMLRLEQVEDHLQRGADARPAVDRHRREIAWVRANPGPAVYGTPPSAPPSLRGLPTAGRRVNEGLLFLMEQELTKPPASSEGVIRGTGTSAGVYRGRVRVISSAERLHELRQGEVLVCPSTSAAWMMVFHRAGAIVADYGSVLTHTSIVAREHRLPAVVGTHGATRKLRDGDEVIVDGTAGTVTIVQ